MSVRAPHFLLMSETTSQEDQNEWRFVLASSDGDRKLVASDTEPSVHGERLELLSVVRGLEALDQPSQVTLLTDSRYVSQGIAHGLTEWRSNDWCWERFGELTPVKNRDLWQRVDRALKFHHVDCRTWRFDAPHAPAGPICPPVEKQDEEEQPQPRAARISQRRVAAAAAREADREEAVQSHERHRRRRGLLAACRNWLEQSLDSARSLPAKLSLET